MRIASQRRALAHPIAASNDVQPVDAPESLESVRLSAYERVAVAIASGVVAAAALVGAQALTVAPKYVDFTVGYVAWLAETKLQDLISPFAVIAAWSLASTLLAAQLRRRKQLSQVEAHAFSDQLLVWSLPGCVSLAGLWSDRTLDGGAIALSLFGIVFVTSYVVWTRHTRPALTLQEIGSSGLSIVLLGLVPLEVALCLGRANLYLIDTGTQSLCGAIVYVVIGLGGVVGVTLSVTQPARWSRVWPRLLLCGQLALPAWFVSLSPASLAPVFGRAKPYATTGWLSLLVAVLCVVAVGDVIRRYVRRAGQSSSSSLVSPFALAALVVGLRVSNTALPEVSADDYHFGEQLLGFWSYLQGGIPYVSYTPPHGLIDDDLAQLAAYLFLDGSAASMGEGVRVVTALLIVGAATSLYACTGSALLAFVATCFLGGRLTYFFLTPFLCLWLMPSLRSVPSRWLAVWALTTPLVILGAPPQGVLLVLAFTPMAADVALDLWRNRERARARAWPFAVVVAAWLVVMLATPCGRMLQGAMRYVLENGPINQTAYGIPWTASWRTSGASGLVFEVIRGSWIVLPVVCVRLIQTHFRERARLVPLLCIGFFSVLMIPYAMGRIDVSLLSRPGLYAIFALCALLPLAVWPTAARETKLSVIAALACIGAALHFTPASTRSLATATASTLAVPMLSDGKLVGLPNLGRGVVSAQHWARLTSLRSVLNQHLGPREPYLDLTSRNAQYFYFDRLPIVDVTAAYNVVALPQQQRIVEELSTHPPKLALLEAFNFVHDGGGMALRSPYLTRFVIDHYTPQVEAGFIVGMLDEKAADAPGSNLFLRPALRDITDATWTRGVHQREAAVVFDDPALAAFVRIGDVVQLGDNDSRRVIRVWPGGNAVWLSGAPLEPASTRTKGLRFELRAAAVAEYRASLLQRAFSRQELMKIPVAWGRSESSLAARMTTVAELDALTPTLRDLAGRAGVFTVQGRGAAITYDLSAQSLRGRDVGLLRLDFQCIGGAGEPRLKVSFWGDARAEPYEPSSVVFTAEDGVLIVPLDSSALWLTLKHVRGVRVELLSTGAACRALSVRHARLAQRKF